MNSFTDLRSGIATELGEAIIGEACGPINSYAPVPLVDGFLYIGSQKDASNTKWLDSMGITALCNVGHTCGRPTHMTSPSTSKYAYMEVHAMDSPGYPILSHLKDVVPFLERHRKQGKKVLISCHQGINRSATLAAAYLSALTNTPMGEIINGMRAKRPVLFNDGFVSALMAWDRQPLRKALHTNYN